MVGRARLNEELDDTMVCRATLRPQSCVARSHDTIVGRARLNEDLDDTLVGVMREPAG
jgi:hypothetical protein